MLFAIFYRLLRRIIGLGGSGWDRDLQIEVLVLRHQVQTLSRKAGRPKLSRLDKVFLAACSRLLPRSHWGSFIMAPSTLLRWHRELVKRKWTYKAKKLGRPPVDPKLVAMICRMARENPTWGYMRIQGECRKIGVRVSATTVKKVMGAAGLDPHHVGTVRPGLSSYAPRQRASLRVILQRGIGGPSHVLRAVLHRGRHPAIEGHCFDP